MPTCFLSEKIQPDTVCTSVAQYQAEIALQGNQNTFGNLYFSTDRPGNHHMSPAQR
jgi:hypothetical protein